MLDVHESQPDRVADVFAYPDYPGMNGFRAVESFEAAMAQAQDTGAIRVERAKGADSHEIKRIRLVNPEKLYALLGRRPAAELSREAVERVASGIRGPAPDWVVGELEQLRANWTVRKPYQGLEPSDLEEATKLFQLVAAIATSVSGLSRRQFSVAITGDSKALERLELAVARIVKAAFGLDVPDDQVLDLLGIASYPDPVALRGPFAFRRHGADVPVSIFSPYASIPAESLDGLVCDRPPAYVLTIENKTSFQQYVRAIDDAGAVVYTGGFPSSAVAAAIRSLAASPAASASWFHWGDVDAGGVRIFRQIEGLLAEAGIALRPHLMSAEIARERGKKASAAPSLGGLAKSSSAIASLAAYLAGGEGEVFNLEQEAILPAPPI
ncbi:MAG: DUF2399 domain-containing protein [Hyphomicrobiales bacterium]|nr:DUF2399 domain-containing protein [Hyphomicrobiales bacterium]